MSRVNSHTIAMHVIRLFSFLNVSCFVILLFCEMRISATKVCVTFFIHWTLDSTQNIIIVCPLLTSFCHCHFHISLVHFHHRVSMLSHSTFTPYLTYTHPHPCKHQVHNTPLITPCLGLS